MRDKVGKIITVTAFGLMFRFLVALAHGAVSHIARISATNLKKLHAISVWFLLCF